MDSGFLNNWWDDPEEETFPPYRDLTATDRAQFAASLLCQEPSTIEGGTGISFYAEVVAAELHGRRVQGALEKAAIEKERLAKERAAEEAKWAGLRAWGAKVDRRKAKRAAELATEKTPETERPEPVVSPAPFRRRPTTIVLVDPPPPPPPLYARPKDPTLKAKQAEERERIREELSALRARLSAIRASLG